MRALPVALVVALLALAVPAQAAGLSAALVARMLESFDRDARALRVDALAAALAADASIRLRTRALGAPQELRPTAAAYLDSARATLGELQRDGVRYGLAAGDPVIVVDPGGRSATSTTESTERYEFPDGRQLTTVNRAVLRFEWRDGQAVVVAIEQEDLTPPTPPVPVPPAAAGPARAGPAAAP